MGNIDRAFAGDAGALSRCLWASHLAGQALNAGVVLGHSLAYCLAFEHPMAHGTSCALARPYCLAYNQELPEGLASSLSMAITQGHSENLRVAAQYVLDTSVRLGLPTTLNDVDIPRAAEKRIAQRCVTEYPRPNNPVPLSEPLLVALVAAMRDGDLDSAFAINSQGAKS
jgi:alcohol dehydrogenase class IV